MEDWVRSTFKVQVFEPGDPEHMFFAHNGRVCTLPLPAFLEYTEGVAAPPSLADLKDIAPDDQRRWHAFFDSWDEQGLLD